MLLAIVIAKGLSELALVFLLGRMVLGWLIGGRQAGNLVWQLLDIAASPVLRFTRVFCPKFIADGQIPLAALGMLLVLWLLLVKVKIGYCLQVGLNSCH